MDALFDIQPRPLAAEQPSFAPEKERRDNEGRSFDDALTSTQERTPRHEETKREQDIKEHVPSSHEKQATREGQTHQQSDTQHVAAHETERRGQSSQTNSAAEPNKNESAPIKTETPNTQNTGASQPENTKANAAQPALPLSPNQTGANTQGTQGTALKGASAAHTIEEANSLQNSKPQGNAEAASQNAAKGTPTPTTNTHNIASEDLPRVTVAQNAATHNSSTQNAEALQANGQEKTPNEKAAPTLAAMPQGTHESKGKEAASLGHNISKNPENASPTSGPAQASENPAVKAQVTPQGPHELSAQKGDAQKASAQTTANNVGPAAAMTKENVTSAFAATALANEVQNKKETQATSAATQAPVEEAPNPGRDIQALFNSKGKTGHSDKVITEAAARSTRNKGATTPALSGASGQSAAEQTNTQQVFKTPEASNLMDSERQVAIDTDIKASQAATSTQTERPNGGLPSTTLSVRFSGPLNQPQVPPTSLAMHIARNVSQGVTQFEIRLDPQEMGRIDVRLEMNQDGRMNAVLVAERPETLDMLQRDARQLERALAELGVDVKSDSLNFSLREDNENGTQDKNSWGDTGIDLLAQEDDTQSLSSLNLNTAPIDLYGFKTVGSPGLNIQV